MTGLTTSSKTGCRDGLSNEEKKNSSDNFELHLKLVQGQAGGIIMIHDDCSRTYSFLNRKFFFTGPANSLFTVKSLEPYRVMAEKDIHFREQNTSFTPMTH